MATTLAQLRTIVYSLLREEENNSAYPYTLVDLLLNAAQQKICFGNVVSPLTKEKLKKGQLSFIQTDKFYTTIADITATSDILADDDTIDATTTGYPEDGYLFINGNIIAYTATTATQFTGCTNVLGDFPSGTAISHVYVLPTNYASVINITYDNKIKLEGKLYDDIFEDLNSNKRTAYPNYSYFNLSNYSKPFYTIKDDTYLILFNLTAADKSLRLRYEKKPTTLTAAGDTATISNDIYAQTTIPYLAVGELLYNRGEEGRAAEIINFGMGQIEEMYAYYDQASFEKISGTHYKMAKGKLNI